jgi:NAD+ synthase
MEFSTHALDLDPAATESRLHTWIRTVVREDLRKAGAVVGLSGGIDSAVVATLCARALGPKRVLGVALPEHESENRSQQLARDLADKLGIDFVTQEISSGLEGLDCYRRRNEAIRSVFPDFEESWTAKITNPGNILDKKTLNFFRLTVQPPAGEPRSARLSGGAYLQIVAASNLKQRLRMAALYYHAERLNRAVAGTANRDELGQGFFVKYGDGGADLHPIMRLFKTQVFELGQHLGVPSAILHRAPTTDTYSAEVSQEEFYYGLDFRRMDLITWAMEIDAPVAEVANALELSPEQVERAMSAIRRKREATEYLRSSPLTAIGQGQQTPIDPVLVVENAFSR